MTRNKTILSLSLVMMLMAGTALAGCSSSTGQTGGGNGSNKGSAGSGDNNGGTAATGETVDWSQVEADIRFVYPGTSELEKELAEQFKAKMKEKYPKVNIEYMFLSWNDMEKKLAVMINSNDWPDMTMTQDVTNLVQLKGLADLTPFLNAADSKIKRDNFLPGTLEYVSRGDAVYYIPNLVNSFSLMVNEAMLEEAGMKLDELRTWADVERAAELMTKDGKYGFGYPLGASRFAFRVPFTAGYSNELVLDDTSETSKQKYLETLQHMQNLEKFQPKAHLTWGYPEMFRAFSNGEVGMIAAGTFFSANVYSINPDIMNTARAIPYPSGPSAAKPQAPVSSVGVAMFEGSKHKELVWKLMEEWSSAEFNTTQAATVNISAFKDANLEAIIEKAESIYPKTIDGHKRLLEDFNAMVNTAGAPMATIPGQSEMEVVVQDNMQKLLTGKSTVEESYEAIRAGIDAIKAKFN
ncbi:ABC transporter substrate-binding protein [Paenibacillus sp. GCM10027626]|uniref:ABC transporter substrate-binding protein n=1 Tax=Paenibacillus sp. GCM10027626 TaxID=3273411 RepID=UPI00362D51FD